MPYNDPLNSMVQQLQHYTCRSCDIRNTNHIAQLYSICAISIFTWSAWKEDQIMVIRRSTWCTAPYVKKWGFQTYRLPSLDCTGTIIPPHTHTPSFLFSLICFIIFIFIFISSSTLSLSTSFYWLFYCYLSFTPLSLHSFYVFFYLHYHTIIIYIVILFQYYLRFFYSLFFLIDLTLDSSSLY
jgi:hypothetical protein